MSLACVTGRFQPVHRDHVWLFGAALAEHDELVVAVTNPDPGARRVETSSGHRHRDEANPFSYFERHRLLSAALRGIGVADRCAIVPFDLTAPEHWAQYVPREAVQYVRVFSDWEREKVRRFTEAGYRVVALPGDPATRLSASAVRDALRAGDDWAGHLPAGVPDVLRGLLAGRPMAERGAG